MIKVREVRAERLDELPPDDPAARASRRDLVRINAMMGNARTVSRLLQKRPRRILEIGAGDGAFLLRVVRRLGRPEPHGLALLVDRQEPTSLLPFERWGWSSKWIAADVFDFLRDPWEKPFDAVVANLFLHHFEDEPLRELLRLVAERTDLFVACEPARTEIGLLGCRLMPLLGFHEVTLHDARVSVLAGFRDRELSALWPSNGWAVEERAVAPFSHAFWAVRR